MDIKVGDTVVVLDTGLIGLSKGHYNYGDRAVVVNISWGELRCDFSSNPKVKDNGIWFVSTGSVYVVKKAAPKNGK